MKYWITIAALLLTVSVSAQADDAVDAKIRAAMNVVIPGATPDSIVAAPIKGLYQVAYGPKLFYVSADGRYLISGDMYDLKARSNLTEASRSKARVEAIDTLGKKAMIIYPAHGKVKHTITVFTDIDCPYCRKLHQGMKEMNDLGITVRYLAFPRAGIPSPSYDKAVSVWCAPDRNKAMDMAKDEDKIVPRTCADNPVEKEYMLGQLMGVTGTPTIVMEDGSILPGYVPPQRLAQLLDQQEVAQK